MRRLLRIIGILLLLGLVGGGGWFLGRVVPWPPVLLLQVQNPPVEQTEDDKVLRIGTSEKRGAITAPDQRVEILGQVMGPVQAHEVIIRQQGTVQGTVTATGFVGIYGGMVSGNVEAPTVSLEPDFYWSSNTQRRELKIAFAPESGGEVLGDIRATSVNIAPHTRVSGSVLAPEDLVECFGTVLQNISARQVILQDEALVHGDVVVTGESLVMSREAQILGQAKKPDGSGARIVLQPKTDNMKITFPPINPGPSVTYQQVPSVIAFDNGWFWFPMILGWLSLIALVVAFAAKEAREGRDELIQRPWRSLGGGLLASVLFTVLIPLTAITIIGIPISLALVVGATAALVVGMTAVSLLVGEKVGSLLGKWKIEAPFFQTLLGAFLVGQLAWIPVLGWFILMVVGLAGFGAVVQLWKPRLKEAWRSWRETRRRKKAQNKETTKQIKMDEEEKQNPEERP